MQILQLSFRYVFTTFIGLLLAVACDSSKENSTNELYVKTANEYSPVKTTPENKIDNVTVSIKDIDFDTSKIINWPTRWRAL